MSEVRTQFSVFGILKTIIAYFAKFFLLYRYLFAGWNINLWLKLLLISVFAISWIVLTIKIIISSCKINKSKLIELIFLISIFVILCIPVINLEITSLGNIQSDRYSYLISVAFVLILSFYLQNIKMLVSKVISIIVIILFFILTLKTNFIYKQNDRIIKNITDSFLEIHQRGRKVIIINIPDSFNGVYTFRHGFVQAIHRANPKFNDIIEIVSWQAISDSTNLTIKCYHDSIYITDIYKPFTKINYETEYTLIVPDKDLNGFYILKPNFEEFEYLFYYKNRLHLFDYYSFSNKL
jgi:hypothetical protein